MTTRAKVLLEHVPLDGRDVLCLVDQQMSELVRERDRLEGERDLGHQGEVSAQANRLVEPGNRAIQAESSGLSETGCPGAHWTG